VRKYYKTLCFKKFISFFHPKITSTSQRFRGSSDLVKRVPQILRVRRPVR